MSIGFTMYMIGVFFFCLLSYIFLTFIDTTFVEEYISQGIAHLDTQSNSNTEVDPSFIESQRDMTLSATPISIIWQNAVTKLLIAFGITPVFSIILRTPQH